MTEYISKHQGVLAVIAIIVLDIILLVGLNRQPEVDMSIDLMVLHVGLQAFYAIFVLGISQPLDEEVSINTISQKG